MERLACKSCGAPLIIDEEGNNLICPYCETPHTVINSSNNFFNNTLCNLVLERIEDIYPRDMRFCLNTLVELTNLKPHEILGVLCIPGTIILKAISKNNAEAIKKLFEKNGVKLKICNSTKSNQCSLYFCDTSTNCSVEQILDKINSFASITVYSPEKFEKWLKEKKVVWDDLSNVILFPSICKQYLKAKPLLSENMSEKKAKKIKSELEEVGIITSIIEFNNSNFRAL